MTMEVLPNRDTAYLDAALLDDLGHVRVVPAAQLHDLDPLDLRIWAHRHGVYQFPTAELVSWLAPLLEGVKAIEIGAGHGAIARALGIPATDSHQQADPAIAAMYRAMGQPVIQYPKDVRKMDAAEAVRRLSPHTVVGAWITQKYKPGDKDGNMWGVDEESLLRKVRRYILVGNAKVHGDKRILKLPHEELTFPWVVSRASSPELNRIYVWEV
jgi:hypothetical protein